MRITIIPPASPDAEAARPRTVTLEEAEAATQLRAAEIEWAITEHGRCDADDGSVLIEAAPAVTVMWTFDGDGDAEEGTAATGDTAEDAYRAAEAAILRETEDARDRSEFPDDQDWLDVCYCEGWRILGVDQPEA